MDKDIAESGFTEYFGPMKGGKKKTRWTPKKYRFVYWMARLGNSELARKKAGIATPHYGVELLMQPAVQRAVMRELRNVLLSESENEESIIARWAKWANSDMGDYFDEGWILKDITRLTETQRTCIKRVKITETQWTRVVDIELVDAAKANNDLAILHGLLDTHDGRRDDKPEDTAKQIKQMLIEMRGTEGSEKPIVESG